MVNKVTRGHKRFNWCMVLFIGISLVYIGILPDCGGNKQCKEWLGLDLEEDFGAEFIPQWTMKDILWHESIFRYKASREQFKNIENYFIAQGWELREGYLGEERMQSTRTAEYFDFNSKKTFIIIGHFDGTRSKQIIYDKERSLLYFEYCLF